VQTPVTEFIDFRVEDLSIFLLRPLTDAAKDWVAKFLPDDVRTFGIGIADVGLVMRTSVAFTCCLLIAGVVFAWVRTDRAVQERQELAATWSQDGPAFAAVGIDGETLNAHLPDALSAEDDNYVDSVLAASEICNVGRAGKRSRRCRENQS
jgi:hypothetical protein